MDGLDARIVGGARAPAARFDRELTAARMLGRQCGSSSSRRRYGTDANGRSQKALETITTAKPSQRASRSSCRRSRWPAWRRSRREGAVRAGSAAASAMAAWRMRCRSARAGGTCLRLSMSAGGPSADTATRADERERINNLRYGCLAYAVIRLSAETVMVIGYSRSWYHNRAKYRPMGLGRSAPASATRRQSQSARARRPRRRAGRPARPGPRWRRRSLRWWILRPPPPPSRRQRRRPPGDSPAPAPPAGIGPDPTRRTPAAPWRSRRPGWPGRPSAGCQTTAAATTPAAAGRRPGSPRRATWPPRPSAQAAWAEAVAICAGAQHVGGQVRAAAVEFQPAPAPAERWPAAVAVLEAQQPTHAGYHPRQDPRWCVGGVGPPGWVGQNPPSPQAGQFGQRQQRAGRVVGVGHGAAQVAPAPAAGGAAGVRVAGADLAVQQPIERFPRRGHAAGQGVDGHRGVPDRQVRVNGPGPACPLRPGQERQPARDDGVIAPAGGDEAHRHEGRQRLGLQEAPAGGLDGQQPAQGSRRGGPANRGSASCPWARGPAGPGPCRSTRAGRSSPPAAAESGTAPAATPPARTEAAGRPPSPPARRWRRG